MHRKMINRSLQIMAFIIVLFFNRLTYCVAAYLPEELREYVAYVNQLAGRASSTPHLQELCSIIEQNRILTSDVVVRNAVRQALDVLEKNIHRNTIVYDVIIIYLEEYLNRLEERSILLSLQGDRERQVSLPVSSVIHSLQDRSAAVDMMCLSSELACAQNIEVCGNAKIAGDWDRKKENTKNIRPNRDDDPSITFTPNMMTSTLSSLPNITFAMSGISSAIINAWSMSPSYMPQAPINMQFGIPGDFKAERPVSLELHFLVKKQFVPNGSVRIRVNAKYMSQRADFDVFGPQTFTHTTDSGSFIVTEPSLVNNVEHVYVIIPIEKSAIDKYDFALLSVSRVTPTFGVEYAEDIYLAAAAFKYTGQ